jgi:steroid 5-alpha reductase family enzyme
MITALATTLFISLSAFTGIWLIHVKLKDVGIVDYYWAPGFVVISMAHAWFFQFNSASWLLFLLLCVWSSRLTSHLVDRHLRMDSEDARYAAMRAAGGENFWWKSLFSIFLLQGFLLWLIASPLHVVALQDSAPMYEPLMIFGILLFGIGFVVETMADWQLRQFRLEKANKRQLMQSGLWSLSRHPNYLGEMILWSGIGFIAFSASGSYFAFVGPLILIVVMRLVSIPLTEQHLAKTRPAFQSYADRTAILSPISKKTA